MLTKYSTSKMRVGTWRILKIGNSQIKQYPSNINWTGFSGRHDCLATLENREESHSERQKRRIKAQSKLSSWKKQLVDHALFILILEAFNKSVNIEEQQ